MLLKTSITCNGFHEKFETKKCTKINENVKANTTTKKTKLNEISIITISTEL